MYEIFEDLVEEVILAHPLKVKAIASAKVKTDAIDSRTLAHLLMADLILQAHLRKGDNRVIQRVIRPQGFYGRDENQIEVPTTSDKLQKKASAPLPTTLSIAPMND